MECFKKEKLKLEYIKDLDLDNMGDYGLHLLYYCIKNNESDSVKYIISLESNFFSNLIQEFIYDCNKDIFKLLVQSTNKQFLYNIANHIYLMYWRDSQFFEYAIKHFITEKRLNSLIGYIADMAFSNKSSDIIDYLRKNINDIGRIYFDYKILKQT